MDVKVTVLLTHRNLGAVFAAVSRLELQFKLITAMMVDYFFNDLDSDGGLLF